MSGGGDVRPLIAGDTGVGEGMGVARPGEVRGGVLEVV